MIKENLNEKPDDDLILEALYHVAEIRHLLTINDIELNELLSGIQKHAWNAYTALLSLAAKKNLLGPVKPED